MKKFMKTCSCVAPVLLLPISVTAADTTIGMDISKSHALVDNSNYAQRVGQDSVQYVSGMKKGDVLRLESFGTHGVAGLNVRVNLDFKMSPNTAANEVKSVIAGLPAHAATGAWKLSEQTEIAGWINETAKLMDCDKTKGTIIVYTDGVHWTNKVDGQKLAEGKVKLPVYSKKYRKCEVHIRGVGFFAGEQGASYDVVQNLFAAWEEWLSASQYAKSSSVSGSF